MLDDTVLQLIAADIKYQQAEQNKRNLIKLTEDTDRAKWAELQKSETGYLHA